MQDSTKKIVYMLWSVIAVMGVGATIGGVMLVHKTNQLQTSNDDLTGSNDSLRRQVSDLRASPTPSTAALPDASGKPVTATPTPTPAPVASRVPAAPAAAPKAKAR